MADQVEDLGIPMRPARPMAGTTVPPRAVDLSRPGGEPAHTITSPRQSLGTRDNEVEARTLIIGREISLSGEINSCDRLIVEGRIEANLQNCKHITVAETGIFKGKAAIDDAEIRGRFEGDLVVRKRLLIRANGHVSGTITYGEIQIEAGGKISGVIQAQETTNGLRTLKRS
jgi:cytoskeletal protein CcmA (bactofilin family)